VPADVEKDIRLFEALRSRFTRQPKWQALVGWQIYYRAFLQDPPGRSLISHRGPWVGEELQQVEVIEAIAAGKKLIAVSGFPGGGKSRFALEIARRIAGAHRTWDVRFVRHDEAAVRAELQELTTLNRLLLIVDDADESGRPGRGHRGSGHPLPGGHCARGGSWAPQQQADTRAD
jgi:hypothetical protein